MIPIKGLGCWINRLAAIQPISEAVPAARVVRRSTARRIRHRSAALRPDHRRGLSSWMSLKACSAPLIGVGIGIGIEVEGGDTGGLRV